MVKALIIRSDQIPTDIEMEFDKLWSIAEQCKENSSDGAGSGVQKIIQIRNNSLVKPKYSKGDISGSGESVITDSSLLMSDTPGVDADTSACESSFDQTPVKANISNPKTLTRTYTASTAAMSVHESDEEDEKQTETAGGVAKQEVNENVGNTLPQLKQTHDPIQLASLVSNVVIQTLQSMGISQSNPDMNPNPMGQSLDSSFQKKKHESVAKSQDEHPMRNSWNGMSSKSKSNGKSRSKPTKSKSRNLLELSDSDLEWEDSPPSDTTTKHNKSNPRSLLPTKNKAMDYKLSQQLKELQLKQEAHEKQMNYMNILNQVSSMRHLNAGNGHTRGGVLVEVKGEGVESDAVIHDALEWRVGHVLLEENGDNSMNHDVLSVAIQHCAVNSLVDAIGQLFFVDDDHVSAPSTSSDLKLKRVQYVLSNTHLQHIYINHTTLKALNAQALTRYSQLKTLDLSYNNITSITSGTLDLPFLTTLNLSNNLLKSLDYLQELTSLQVLDASSNKISSLTMSIHMLLPLADCLVKLDVSMNPVSDDDSLMFIFHPCIRCTRLLEPCIVYYSRPVFNKERDPYLFMTYRWLPIKDTVRSVLTFCLIWSVWMERTFKNSCNTIKEKSPMDLHPLTRLIKASIPFLPAVFLLRW